MTRPFDPPAPQGYEAHEADQAWTTRCPMCCSGFDDAYLCHQLPCTAPERSDGRWVYFVRAVPAKGE